MVTRLRRRSRRPSGYTGMFEPVLRELAAETPQGLRERLGKLGPVAREALVTSLAHHERRTMREHPRLRTLDIVDTTEEEVKP